MNVRVGVAVLLAKLTSLVIKILGLGAAATWPGEIALMISSNILKPLSSQLSRGIILVAGTNGKTTTSLMLTKILESVGYRVIHNASGANLLNGVVSSLVAASDWMGQMRADWGVFEVDENALPGVVNHLYSSSEESSTSREVSQKKFSTSSNNKTFAIVLLNLFRDQLDRYGEVDVIVEKWEHALKALSYQPSAISQKNNVTLILNADDPGVAYLGRGWGGGIMYFGLNDKSKFLPSAEHATDSTFCLTCGGRLTYEGIYYSHIGVWKCTKCGAKRPKPDIDTWPSPLPGLYNQYNTLAAVAAARSLNISDKIINQALSGFTPAFGRQEELEMDGKRVKIFLSKNPAGFNASLRTVLELKPKTLLVVLNDRIPDGRDVSWIWDVDFEMLVDKDANQNHELTRIIASGERCYDLALRLKYSELQNVTVEPNLATAIQMSLHATTKGETLYVLPTYSAMLEVRMIFTGRKIF